MMLVTLLAAHVVAALGVGAVLLLPFLVDQPLAAHRVLLVLRVSAIFAAVTGGFLWLILRPQGLFIVVSLVLLAVVVAAIGLRIAPAFSRPAGDARAQRRLRLESGLVAGLTVAIAVLMVAKP